MLKRGGGVSRLDIFSDRINDKVIGPMQTGSANYIYGNVRAGVLCSVASETFWHLSELNNSISFVGMRQVYSAKTEPLPKAKGIVAYRVYTVFTNFSKSIDSFFYWEWTHVACTNVSFDVPGLTWRLRWNNGMRNRFKFDLRGYFGIRWPVIRPNSTTNENKINLDVFSDGMNRILSL